MPKTTHGLYKHPLYYTWLSMKQRCYNPNVARYARYGGRGITVCDRWKNSFPNFLNDMGEKPSSSHSIDRIDNDGNYEPGNCRWSTNEIQNTNQGLRKDNTSGYTGVKWYKKTRRWFVDIRVNNKKVSIGYFKDKNEAIAARKIALENKLKIYKESEL